MGVNFIGAVDPVGLLGAPNPDNWPAPNGEPQAGILYRADPTMGIFRLDVTGIKAEPLPCSHNFAPHHPDVLAEMVKSVRGYA